MRRSMLVVGIAVVLGTPALNAQADEPKPEQIIDKAIRAHGGENRLEGLSGFIYKDRTVYVGGPTRSWELSVDLPGRYRSESKVEPEGKTQSLIVIDGDHGWLKLNGVVTPYPSSFINTMQKYTIPYPGPRSILRLPGPAKEPEVPFLHGRGVHDRRPSRRGPPHEAGRAGLSRPGTSTRNPAGCSRRSHAGRTSRERTP